MLDEMLAKLPPEAQRDAIAYVQSLLAKHDQPARKPLTFSWAGGLERLRDQYTSVELQHLASKWR